MFDVKPNAVRDDKAHQNRTADEQGPRHLQLLHRHDLRDDTNESYDCQFKYDRTRKPPPLNKIIRDRISFLGTLKLQKLVGHEDIQHVG